MRLLKLNEPVKIQPIETIKLNFCSSNNTKEEEEAIQLQTNKNEPKKKEVRTIERRIV